MIDHLILDWAGTLSDDLTTTFEVTNEVLVELGGRAVDLETYRREFTIPVMGFYDRHAPGHTLEVVDEAFFRRYRQRVSDLAWYPGAEELIRICRGRGMRLYLLSTIPNDILEPALVARGLRDHFVGLYGGAVDKTLVLPRLLAEHGLPPDRTLFVGDSPHDVEAANLSRLRAGAALWGYSPRDRFDTVEPDYFFEDVAALSFELDREHLYARVPLVIATVGGIVTRDDGRILVVRTEKWSNTFGIPGGKIQYGETMEAAYERELLEETGLELADTRFVMIQDCIESEEFVEPRHFLLINYISRAVDPERLRANYELEECRWVTPREAMTMRLNRPTRIVLEEAARLEQLDLTGEQT